MEPELRLKTLRLLQEVSDPISWKQARRALPASVCAATEQVARTRGHAPEGMEPLPQARAFARALALSERRGDPAASKALRDGFDLLGARASVAAQNSGYAAMLDEAHAPARASKDLASEIEPIVPSAPRKQQGRARDPKMTVNNSHLMPLSSSALLGATSDVAIAKQVLRAFVGSNGPGFFETLAKEMRAGDAFEKDRSVSTEQAMSVSPSPVSDDQEAIMGKMFGCQIEATHVAGADDIVAQIGDGGTLKHAELQRAVENFVKLSTEAGTIGKTDPSVPAAWKARLNALVLNGPSMTATKVESAQEWEWAMKHALRAGSLYSQASELKTDKPRDDWASWKFMNTVTPSDKWINHQLSKELVEWDSQYTDYMVQLSSVDVISRDAVVKEFKALSQDQVKKIVDAEPVSQEWKDRFMDRAKNVNTPAAQAKFESHRELEWSLKTIYQQGSKAQTGALPQKNDLAKKLIQEQQKKQTRSMGMRLF